MSVKQNKRHWEDLGRLDPFWAMTGTHKFGTWDIEAFLQTGDDQVDAFLSAAAELGVPAGREAVLDFGCGVGRLARGFRSQFDAYTGLDISESLVERARALHRGLTNAAFIVHDRRAFADIADSSIDLVYCWSVMQHITDRREAVRLIGEMVRVLKPGGLVAFNAMHHIRTLYRLQPRRRAYALLQAIGVPERVLYERLRLYPQYPTALPEPVVLTHLDRHGAHVLRVERDEPSTSPHQFRTYWATK